MAFIKADFPEEIKRDFQEFCKLRDQKEAEVVRRAVKHYMAQHSGVTHARATLKNKSL